MGLARTAVLLLMNPEKVQKPQSCLGSLLNPATNIRYWGGVLSPDGKVITSSPLNPATDIKYYGGVLSLEGATYVK